MVISASRRTDIPAFYAVWFQTRIREGYVLVRNPMNPHQISRIDLSPQAAEAIVFWTKNPLPMLGGLDLLKQYGYYFQFTLTPYGRDIEPGLPSKREVLLPAFAELSRRIGADRCIWRYDPILLNARYTAEVHIQAFTQMAALLQGCTKQCIISFVDSYRNTQRNSAALALQPIAQKEMFTLAAAFSRIATQHGIMLSTCSEAVDLSQFGISHGHCIDGQLLEKILDCPLSLEKDPNQRKDCGCMASIDIGAYNSCPNGCRYCYANYNEPLVAQNFRHHHPDSPLLFGTVGAEDKITERKMKSIRMEQMRLF